MAMYCSHRSLSMNTKYDADKANRHSVCRSRPELLEESVGVWSKNNYYSPATLPLSQRCLSRNAASLATLPNHVLLSRASCVARNLHGRKSSACYAGVSSIKRGRTYQESKVSSKPYHSFYIMIVLFQYTDNRTTSAFACRTRRSRVTCHAIHSPYGNCHLLTSSLASMQFAN